MKLKHKKIKWALLLLLLAPPLTLFADNCSGLFDCFGNMRAAAAAAVALALFGALVSMGLDFIPVVGTIKGGIEAITGRDLITGQELSAWERALGVLPFVGALATAATAAKTLDKVTDVARAADKVGDAARAGDKVSDVGKTISKTGDDVADAVNKASKEKLPNSKCTKVGDPVDVASGRVFSEAIDFDLPGPIPLTWERVWYADSGYEGPLGHGWHHNFDMAIWLNEPEGELVVRNYDGRLLYFEQPLAGQKVFHRKERYELFDEEGSYVLWSIDKRVYYCFSAINGLAQQKLVRIKNNNGHQINIQYNEAGLLEKITDSSGRKIQIAYGPHNRIASVHLPGAQRHNETFMAVGYNYDEQTGDLTMVTDALGHLKTFEYKKHLLTKRVLPNGLQFYFEYDGEGTSAKCIKTWGDGNYLANTFVYNDRSTIVTNSLGHSTTYTHQNGLVVALQNSLGAEKKFGYNQYNELVEETDALGRATHYEYDARGNKILAQHPNGATTLVAFTDDLITGATDLMGQQWQWKYDEKGNLTEKVLPTGSHIRFSYKNGLVATMHDPLGNQYAYVYDGALNHSQTIAPDNSTRSWLYDNLGRCTKYTDACGASQWMVYDLKGNLVQVNEPDGNERRFAYDALDNLVMAKDREREVRYEYTQIDNLAAKHEANTTVRFSYDTEGSPVTIINQKGDTYHCVLDAEGRVIAETDFGGSTRKYSRDVVGNIVATLLPDGHTIQYGYDALNRLVRANYPDGELCEYTYNNAGQLISAVNNSSSVQLSYDALGRKIKETQGIYTVETGYDVLDNRIRVSSDLGADIQKEYDSQGNVLRLNAGDWQAQIEYDAMGRELKRMLPGNLLQQWKRDDIGRPLYQQVLLKDDKKRTRQYQWFSSNRLEQVTDSRLGVTYFEYDVLGALNKAIYGNGDTENRFGDVVNNVYKQPDLADRQYSPAGQLLKSEKFTYRYDALGNLSEKMGLDGSKWQYKWYANGMLQSVQTPDGKQIQFEYDALGRRIAKHIGNKTIKWVWDGDNLLHEITENRFDGTNVDELITWVFDENSYVPAGKLKNGIACSVIANHMGTPLEMYDQAGDNLWAVEPGIYGDCHTIKGNLADCPFRFQGQYADVETGLFYNRFRYYDPEGGVYISPDPIGMAGGTALYAYVQNTNSYVDVLGLNGTPFGPIALGKDPHFKNLPGSTWQNWNRDGITRRTVASRFGRAMHQAAQRASHIHFALDGIDDISKAVKEGGSYGFVHDKWVKSIGDGAPIRVKNMTNAELHYIARNPELLGKTTFYRNGVPVTGDDLNTVKNQLQKIC